MRHGTGPTLSPTLATLSNAQDAAHPRGRRPRRSLDLGSRAERRKQPVLTLLEDERVCPKTRRPLVYAIGASTMGHPLGKILSKRLKKWGARLQKWAKASTGLARQDFWDWLAKAREIKANKDPDVFIVSLGVNDNQALSIRSKKRRTGFRWVNPVFDEWGELYARRVDELLDILTGPERDTPVIWIGPYAFEGERARKMGPRIHRIQRERVEAFDGPVTYVDVFSKTRHGDKIVWRFTPPGSSRRIKARAGDGIHLTLPAIEAWMVTPVMDALGRCLRPAPRDLPRRVRSSESRRERERASPGEARSLPLSKR